MRGSTIASCLGHVLGYTSKAHAFPLTLGIHTDITRKRVRNQNVFIYPLTTIKDGHGNDSTYSITTRTDRKGP